MKQKKPSSLKSSMDALADTPVRWREMNKHQRDFTRWLESAETAIHARSVVGAGADADKSRTDALAHIEAAKELAGSIKWVKPWTTPGTVVIIMKDGTEQELSTDIGSPIELPAGAVSVTYTRVVKE